MKKFITTTALVGVLITSTVSATPKIRIDITEQISDKALRQFGSTFYRATDVKWSIDSKYQKASFVLNGKNMTALYNLDGKFLVAMQIISEDQIPAGAKKSLSELYKNYTVTEVVKVVERPADFEYENDVDSYYASCKADGKNVFVLISPSDDVKVVRVEKSAE